jgi:hypothetical protein
MLNVFVSGKLCVSVLKTMHHHLLEIGEFEKFSLSSKVASKRVQPSGIKLIIYSKVINDLFEEFTYETSNF